MQPYLMAGDPYREGDSDRKGPVTVPSHSSRPAPMTVTMPGGQGARLHDQLIINPIAIALGADPKAQDVTERRGAVAAARRAAILREIEASSGDWRLRAAPIANRLGITMRYLHMLLEKTGRSFSQHVLERRLRRAAELLHSPQQRTLKISTIAFECGFNDLSYFNRSFRRRYDLTPSALRAHAIRQIKLSCQALHEGMPRSK
jgi:AraC-like DNA-binding protein